jgi:hypothetical protein
MLPALPLESVLLSSARKQARAVPSRLPYPSVSHAHTFKPYKDPNQLTQLPGDPWGVISASVGVEFTKESSKTFTGTFPLQEGGSGYVVYTPYTQCYKGYFSGDCADDGQSIEVCYPEKNSDGSLLGQLRGVIIRT